MCKQGEPNFNYMAMFAFSGTILLMSMRTGDMMSDAYFLEEAMEFFIFTTPISLHCNDFPIEFALNELLKVKEHLINFRMIFKQINPSEFAEIINIWNSHNRHVC
jgi:hypothetical protein